MCVNAAADFFEGQTPNQDLLYQLEIPGYTKDSQSGAQEPPGVLEGDPCE